MRSPVAYRTTSRVDLCRAKDEAVGSAALSSATTHYMPDQTYKRLDLASERLVDAAEEFVAELFE
jgi:hypothetical protein